MKKVFIHNPIFRILAPIAYGIVVYILILLVFDSIQSLNENYFNQEAYICIGLTYLVFESLRFVIIVLDKYVKVDENLKPRIAIQVITTTILSVSIVSGGLILYFTEFLNYQGFETELMAFNAIFVVTTLLYNMLYLSLIYLNMQNITKLEEENVKQKNLEYQMLCFNNELNPELLYDSLETLLDLLHHDEDDSERFIDKLSSVYRYILSNKNNELVQVKEELSTAEDLLYLLNVKHDGNVSLTTKITGELEELYLVPGTFNLILENITSSNLISKRRPLKISCYQDEEYLVIQVKTNEKLSLPNKYTLHGRLQEAYEYFTILPIIELKAYGDLFIKVPLLKLATPQPILTTIDNA